MSLIRLLKVRDSPYPSTSFGLSVSIAARAYKQALSTLSTLTSHLPAFTFDPTLITIAKPKSLLSAFLPNPQGQGPVDSALKMLIKNYHSMRCLISALRTGQDSSGKGFRQKDEEQRTKAIKVLDLLHHSVELGSMDALYTLAKISLVSTFFVLCSMDFFTRHRYDLASPYTAFSIGLHVSVRIFL